MESTADCADEDSDSDGEIQLCDVPPHSCLPTHTAIDRQVDRADKQQGSSTMQQGDSPRYSGCNDATDSSTHDTKNCKSRLPVILPRTFDGSTDWQAFKLHYLCCAEGNGWSDEESCRYLRTRLVGDAALSLFQAST